MICGAPAYQGWPDSASRLMWRTRFSTIRLAESLESLQCISAMTFWPSARTHWNAGALMLPKLPKLQLFRMLRESALADGWVLISCLQPSAGRHLTTCCTFKVTQTPLGGPRPHRIVMEDPVARLPSTRGCAATPARHLGNLIRMLL